MKPRILIVNDDPRLCETRRLLLENCGAEVFTACGQPSEVEGKLHLSPDLVLIDSTNVGPRRGEEICHFVKRIDPACCVAMLASPEIGSAVETAADYFIARTGPRQMLVEINGLLHERLDVNLWDSSTKHGDQGSLV